jgi:hypothetical protein
MGKKKRSERLNSEFTEGAEGTERREKERACPEKPGQARESAIQRSYFFAAA